MAESNYRITASGKKLYDSQIRANRKYEIENYSKVGFRFKKDEWAELKERILATGQSLNSFALDAIKEKLERM